MLRAAATAEVDSSRRRFCTPPTRPDPSPSPPPPPALVARPPHPSCSPTTPVVTAANDLAFRQSDVYTLSRVLPGILVACSARVLLLLCAPNRRSFLRFDLRGRSLGVSPRREVVVPVVLLFLSPRAVLVITVRVRRINPEGIFIIAGVVSRDSG